MVPRVNPWNGIGIAAGMDIFMIFQHLGSLLSDVDLNWDEILKSCGGIKLESGMRFKEVVD